MAEVCLARKQHKILIDDNYRYQIERAYKDKIYWKCVAYKTSCKARLHAVQGQLCIYTFYRVRYA